MLIHIGFPKTATTFLQGVIFRPEHGYTDAWVGVDKGEVVEHFLLTHPGRFDARAVRARFEADHAEHAPALVRTISHETLSGSELHDWRQVAMVPERLHATFPEARIVMFIREQQAMLRSSYKQYVWEGGSLAPERYFGAGHWRPGFRPPGDLERLDYHLTIERYHVLFGAERVLVVPYEDFAARPAETLLRLHRFAGAPEVVQATGERRNAGLGAAATEALRRLNRVIRRPEGWSGERADLPLAYRAKYRLVGLADRVLPARWHEARGRRVAETIARLTAGRYVESNRRTAALTGLALDDLGYEI